MGSLGTSIPQDLDPLSSERDAHPPHYTLNCEEPTMPWPRPSTATRNPNSSTAPPDRGHGRRSKIANSRPSAGCTGTTRSASTATSTTSRLSSPSRRDVLTKPAAISWRESNSASQSQGASPHRRQPHPMTPTQCPKSPVSAGRRVRAHDDEPELSAIPATSEARIVLRFGFHYDPSASAT